MVQGVLLASRWTKRSVLAPSAVSLVLPSHLLPGCCSASPAGLLPGRLIFRQVSFWRATSPLPGLPARWVCHPAMSPGALVHCKARISRGASLICNPVPLPLWSISIRAGLPSRSRLLLWCPAGASTSAPLVLRPERRWLSLLPGKRASPCSPQPEPTPGMWSSPPALSPPLLPSRPVPNRALMRPPRLIQSPPYRHCFLFSAFSPVTSRRVRQAAPCPPPSRRS